MKINFLLLLSIIIVQIGCTDSVKSQEFPIILQEKSAQCGPVCLQMVSKYYGKHIDLEELEKLSGMTDEGTSLLGLSEAAQSIGLKNLGVKISYEQLTNEVPLPAILHWNNNHYIVVHKISQNKVWVADPQLGKIQYSKKEFCDNWIKGEIATATEGIALLIEKTNDF